MSAGGRPWLGRSSPCDQHSCPPIHPHNHRYTSPHVRILIRELRVLAYSQFLESYKSVRLTSMAQAFGVSVDFLDK